MLIQYPYVYISGALSDLNPERRVELRTFYEKIGRLCDETGFAAHIPTFMNDSDRSGHYESVDDYVRKHICGARLLIAYVGEPSLGVGVGIEIAHHANVPVWLLAEKAKFDEKRISQLARGNPACRKGVVITFTDTAHAEMQLHLELRKLRNQSTSQHSPFMRCVEERK